MTDRPDIHKAAGVIVKDRRFLVTRSVGKDFFVAPGGKLEPGEGTIEALVRELKEELDIAINTPSLESLGTFHATAAGSADRKLQMDVYIVWDYDGTITPTSEVEELRWVNSLTDDISIGSIFQHDVAPLLKKRGLID